MSKRKYDLADFIPDHRLVDERGPTIERAKRSDWSFEVGDTGVVTVRQSPIERALARRAINRRQMRAGQKLYAHWYKSGVGQELGSCDFDRVLSGEGNFGGMARTETQALHRQRLRSALQLVIDKMNAAGHIGRDAVVVLEGVVFRDMPFEQAGHKIGYRGRDLAAHMALILIRCSLNILATDWGIR